MLRDWPPGGGQRADPNWCYNYADPVTQRIYVAPAGSDIGGYYEYNPLTDSYVTRNISLSIPPYYWGQSNSTAAVLGREIFHWTHETQGFFAFHMDTKAWRAIPISQAVPFVGNTDNTLTILAAADINKILVVNNRGRMWTADPTTGAIADFAFVGSNEYAPTSTGTPGNGLFGKLQYWPAAKMVVATAMHTSNVRVMRVA